MYHEIEFPHETIYMQEPEQQIWGLGKWMDGPGESMEKRGIWKVHFEAGRICLFIIECAIIYLQVISGQIRRFLVTWND